MENSTNTTDTPTDACQEELDSVNFCVSLYPDKCSCILNPESFSSSFPTELDASFQDLMNNAGDQDKEEFCKDAEKSICDFIQEKSSCCCQAETLSYTACYVSAMVASAFAEAPTCARSVRCALQVLPSDEEMADQQNRQRWMIYAIVASILCALLCLICYCCFSFRRRRIIIKEKNSRQALEINVVCNTENNTTETIRETTTERQESIKETSTKKKTTKNDKKVIKKDKKSTNKNDDDGSDSSFNWDEYNPTTPIRQQSDLDIEKGRVSPVKKDRKLDEERKPSSQRTLELREKRRRIESWNDTEKERRRSSRSLCSTSSSTVSSTERRKKTIKKSRSKRDRSGTEQSIRKARTVLETIQSAQSDGGGATKILVVPALREVIELLEEEKWKLDHRQKSIEEEKLRLQSEVEASKAYLDELNDKNQRTEVELQKAKVNTELIRSNSMKDLAEADPHALKSDLTKLTEERNEMMQLLTRLKQAEKELGQTLETSKETVGALQREMKRTGSQLALAEISKVHEQKQIVHAENELVEYIDRADAAEEASRRDELAYDEEDQYLADMDGAPYDDDEEYRYHQDCDHPNEYGAYDNGYGEEYGDDGYYEPGAFSVVFVDEDGQYIEEGYVVYDDGV